MCRWTASESKEHGREFLWAANGCALCLECYETCRKNSYPTGPHILHLSG